MYYSIYDVVVGEAVSGGHQTLPHANAENHQHQRRGDYISTHTLVHMRTLKGYKVLSGQIRICGFLLL